MVKKGLLFGEDVFQSVVLKVEEKKTEKLFNVCVSYS